jgi:DNA-binding CsgD family transcriptional regulator
MKGKLSKREEQILKLLLAEYTQSEISSILGLSYSRVSDVKRIIKGKWEVDSTIGLILESIRRGYVEIERDTFDEIPNFESDGLKNYSSEGVLL